jgi:hypothetical protein
VVFYGWIAEKSGDWAGMLREKMGVGILRTQFVRHGPTNLHKLENMEDL